MSGVIENKERKTNLELLRIISMVLIVMSHSDDWMGLAETYKTTVCINKFIVDWLHIGGQIGTGCFLLITGYFMVEQEFKLKRLFRLLGEVWFYTIGIWGIYIIVKIVMRTFCFSFEFFVQTVKAFFPVLFSHYWFVTAYIILMLLAPFFNKLILTMNKKEYQLLLALLIIIFCVLEGGIPVVLHGMSEGRIMPVFIMYFIAGYIKKHVDNQKDNSKKHLYVAILAYLLLYATAVGIGIISAVLKSESLIEYCYFWRALKSPIVVLINVELFLAFLRIKSIKGGLINQIASNTFGVYLIHANRIIELIVLPKIFPVYKETNSLRLFFYSIGSVLTVYTVSTLIDIVRQRTIEKVWLKLLNAKCGIFEENIKKWIISMSEMTIKVINKIYSSK